MGILDFGAQIRAARQKMGLTQSQAADLLGISRQALSMYENGKRFPPLRDLPEFADKLGVSLTDRDKRDVVQAETTQTKLNAAMFGIVRTYLLDHLPSGHRLCVEGLNERTGQLDALDIETGDVTDPDIIKRVEAAEYDALVAECIDVVEALIDRHILNGI